MASLLAPLLRHFRPGANGNSQGQVSTCGGVPATYPCLPRPTAPACWPRNPPNVASAPDRGCATRARSWLWIFTLHAVHHHGTEGEVGRGAVWPERDGLNSTCRRMMMKKNRKRPTGRTPRRQQITTDGHKARTGTASRPNPIVLTHTTRRGGPRTKPDRRHPHCPAA